MKKIIFILIGAFLAVSMQSQAPDPRIQQFEQERIRHEAQQRALHRNRLKQAESLQRQQRNKRTRYGESWKSTDMGDSPSTAGFGDTRFAGREIRNLSGGSRFKSGMADIGDTPEWNWVRSISGSSGAYLSSVVVDGSSFVYALGTYSDSLEIGSYTKVSMGLHGVFVAKIDKFGEVQWVQTLEALPGENVWGDNLVLAGGSVIVSGSMETDRVSGGGKVANRLDDERSFLAAIGTSGSIDWIKTVGPEWTQKMLSDSENNIYLLGNYMITKYDATGNKQWSTDPEVVIQDFTVKGTEVWVSGGIPHDSVSVGDSVYYYPGGSAYYISRLNTDGGFGFVHFMPATNGSPQWDRMFIRLDSDGNIYLAGSRNGDIDLGGAYLYGYRYMFMAKLGPDMNLVWYHDDNQPAYAYLYDFKQVSDNQFYLFGYFSGDTLVFAGTGTSTENEWGYFTGSINADGIKGELYEHQGYYWPLAYGPGNTVYTSTSENYKRWFHKRSLAGGDFWTVQLKNNGGYASLRYTMDIDKDGNLYAQGSYSGKVNVIGNRIEGQGVFFIKFRNNGSVEWLKTMENPSGGGSGITVDDDGNLYAWGNFYDYIKIGGLEYTSEKEWEESDMYLVKFDKDGDLKFVKQFKGTGEVRGQGGISLTPENDVLITGTFRDTLYLGAYELKSDHTTSNWSSDVFVARVSPTGNIIWARSYGGPNSDYGRSIASDSLGNIYITGYFERSTSFDSIILEIDDGYYNDYFLVKLDPTGNIKWVERGGPQNYQVNTYALTVNGDAIYIQGQAYVYPPDYTNAYFGDKILTSEFEANSFVASYDASGDVNWVQMIKVNNYSAPVYQIDTDDEGNVYVGGLFNDSIVVGSTLVAGTGGYDYYIVKYSSEGDLDWLKTSEGDDTYSDEINLYSISVFEEDVVLLGGSIWEGSYKFGDQVISASSGAAFGGLLGGDIVGCDIILTLNVTDEDFGKADGSADLTISGGTAPYLIDWSNGESDQTSIDSLFAGTYQVTVTDAKGCEQFALFSVNVKNGPVISLDTIGAVTCHGGADGFINITVTGGTEPYTYFWDNGYSSQDLINLSAAPYTVTVTDANGLIVSAGYIVEEPKELDVSYAITQASCGGGSDGVIDVFTSGGTAPYDWEWNTGVFTESLVNEVAGKYTLTVLDKNNCELVVEIALSEKDAPILETELVEPATCGQADGSATVKVVNAAGPVNYLWSDASGTAVPTITGQRSRGYFVTASNNSGCKAVHLVNIPEKKPIENQICLVTVDTVIGSNLIVWEKVADAIQYHIYRETSAKDVYLLAGSTSGTDLSVFVDTVANPLIRGYRYKIAAVDECGNESFLSQLHKTVHMTIGPGLFTGQMNIRWDDYVGENFESFEVWRFSSLNSWELLATLPSNLKSYTDDNVPPGLVFYNVRVPFENACSPTGDFRKAGTGPYTHSLSNLDDNKLKATGIGQKSHMADRFYVYPNPTDGAVTVWSEAFQITEGEILVSDLAGRIVLHEEFRENFSGRLQLDISNQPAGSYLVQLRTGGQVFYQKLVKQ